jgi:hypothetical protein
MLSSCHKDPYQDGTPELPPITMEGKNTLGFLLDGKVWVPYQESSGIFTPTLEFKMDGNVLRGGARLKSKDIDQHFSITIQVENEEIIQIDSNYVGVFFINNKNTGFSCNEYRNSTNTSYIIISKLDWTNRIIAGTFEFPMMVNGCKDTLTIKDGRFDLKF